MSPVYDSFGSTSGWGVFRDVNVGATDRTVTLLVTDIEGPTRLLQQPAERYRFFVTFAQAAAAVQAAVVT